MVPVVAPAVLEYAEPLWGLGWNGWCWWLRAGVGTLLGPGTAGTLICEGWGCCFWSPYLVKLALWVGGWGVGCCLRTA